MATWIIEDFTVKPSGIGAKARGKRILVDDNGIIYNEDIPGYPSMNLPCITDYKKSYRNYSQGDIITQYCNFTTFTLYKIIASDCTPFAYAQRIPNSPTCGYQTPLPEPAVPPNPFGNADYGLYRTYNDCDIDGRSIRVDIKKRSWSGASEEIPNASRSPIVISYPPTENKRTGIRSSEFILNFLSETDYELEYLYTDDERMFKVEAYYLDNNDKIFAGFVVPDSASEPFANAPYPVTVRVSDGLGALKNISYPFPIGSKTDVRQSFKDIICYCLSGTSLNLDIRTISNLYEVKMPNGLNDDPLALSTVNPTRLSDSKGQPKFCYEALQHICDEFGAYIVQVDGVWNFVRVNELSYETIRCRTYSYTGLFKFGSYLSNLREAGHNKEIQLINGNHILDIGNAYKRSLVYIDFGDSPSYIYNGDFSKWDGSNFNGWTRYGGIDIERVQRTVKTTQGSKVLIQDYALQFNAEATSDKWIEAAELDVQIADKISLSFEIAGQNEFENKADDFYEVKLRVSIGEYHLYNSDPDKYEWVKQLSTCTIDVSDFGYVTFSIPEIPKTGKIILQFYGSTVYGKLSGLVTPPSGGRPTRGGTGSGGGVVLKTYIPMLLDNVTINISRTESQPINQILHFSENYASYYNSPNDINLLFGDFVNTPRTLAGGERPTRGGNSSFINYALYAIYTSDGSYSTAWKEFGQPGSPVPIGLHLAKSIIKAYQKPFRFFRGDLRGSNMNYLNVFNIEKLPGKTFAFQGVDFDIKYKEAKNVNLVEIFSKAIRTNDGSIPLAPGQGPPPITQDPNGLIPCVSESVFQCPYELTFGMPAISPADLIETELSYSLTDNACSLDPDTIYYSEEQLDIGVALFSDDTLTPAVDGYYSDGLFLFHVISGLVASVSSCTTPPTPVTYYLWAELSLPNVQNINNIIYGDLEVRILSSQTQPPPFTGGSAFDYSGIIDLVNSKGDSIIIDFISSDTETSFNVKLGTIDEDYEWKILGAAAQSDPVYLGFIQI